MNENEKLGFKTLNRKCLKCGKTLLIAVKEDNSYSGGKYVADIKFKSIDSKAYFKKDGKDVKRFFPIYCYYRLLEKIQLKYMKYEEPEEVWYCDDCYREFKKETENILKDKSDIVEGTQIIKKI